MQAFQIANLIREYIDVLKSKQRGVDQAGDSGGGGAVYGVGYGPNTGYPVSILKKEGTPPPAQQQQQQQHQTVKFNNELTSYG